jgi:capsule polysaccharide export protein KpsE/RkpR
LNPPKPDTVPLIERTSEFEPDVNGYERATDAHAFEPKHLVWLRLLWSERRLLGRVVLYGLIFSTVVAYVLPVRYASTVKLMPPDQQSSSGLAMTAMMAAKNSLGSMGGLGEGLANAAGDLLGLKNSTSLFTDMLGSRTVRDRIINQFDLRKEYRDRYYQDARKDLAKHTDIEVDRKSDTLAITVTDHDAQRAQQMAQAYVEELNRLLSEVSTSSARRERIFIEQRLQTVKQDLDRISKEFSEYESSNTVLDMPYQAKAMVEAAARLQGELIAAQSQLDSLEQIYTPNNVRVRSLKARVDELKGQLKKMSGSASVVNGGPDQESNATDLYPPIKQLPLVGVRWLDLYRESKVQETVYELLTQQYELAKIQEAKEIPTVRVMDAANVPEKISFPPRLLLVCVGTLLGFLLAGTGVVAAAKWREVDPNSPEKQFLTEIWVHLRARMQMARENGRSPIGVARCFLRGEESGLSGKSEQ